MGAMVFAFIMFIVLVVGLIILLIGTIFLIVFKVKKKRNSNKPRKRYLVTAIIFMSIGFLVTSIPVTFVLLLRAGNQSTWDGYVNTGVIAHYDTVENGHNNGRESFILNQVRYVLIPYDGDVKEIGEAVANVEPELDPISKLFSILFNTNNTVTLYAIKNDSGYELLDGYCKESELKGVKAYYDNFENYNFYVSYFNIRAEESDDSYKKIGLTAKKFKELIKIKPKGNIKKVIGNYVEISISAISFDRISYLEGVELIKVKNQLMIIENLRIGKKKDVISCYPLPDDMNKYLLSLLKNE